MPTNTFFRLPAEKRERLMGACWAEFIQNRFDEVSINRIITAAHIPRGSFYQYFTGKHDLFQYLIEDMREYFIQSLRSVLTEGQGELFALPLGAFDRFMYQEGETDPALTRLIQILQVNQGLNFQEFLFDCPGEMPDPLWEVVDTRYLKQPDRAYANHVFFLMVAILACAVAETLHDPARWSRQREILQTRMDIIRFGCAAKTRPGE